MKRVELKSCFGVQETINEIETTSQSCKDDEFESKKQLAEEEEEEPIQAKKTKIQTKILFAADQENLMLLSQKE